MSYDVTSEFFIKKNILFYEANNLINKNIMLDTLIFKENLSKSLLL